MKHQPLKGPLSTPWTINEEIWSTGGNITDKKKPK
jgi:hypothetical protein